MHEKADFWFILPYGLTFEQEVDGEGVWTTLPFSFRHRFVTF